jgi:hypothetical protein
MADRPQKITFGEMREMGVRGVLIYCADYQCSHSIAVMADQWADDLRLSDIEDRFTCSACGHWASPWRRLRYFLIIGSDFMSASTASL